MPQAEVLPVRGDVHEKPVKKLVLKSDDKTLDDIMSKLKADPSLLAKVKDML